jgi:predicted transcriptional regulator
MGTSAQIETQLSSAVAADNTKKAGHHQESAFMTAAHILMRLTQQGKSIEEIARYDFNNNMELVTVWADYMIAVNWMYKDSNSGSRRWIATDNGKKWIDKYYEIRNR